MAFPDGKYEYILAGKRSIETGWLLFQVMNRLFHSFCLLSKMAVAFETSDMILSKEQAEHKFPRHRHQ